MKKFLKYEFIIYKKKFFIKFLINLLVKLKIFFNYLFIIKSFFGLLNLN